ncbi:MAG: hypothetical protein ACOY6K_08260 [Pseudomonadota bacterium]
MDAKNYRVTTKRPIGGRMRQAGEIVSLTAREYAAEAGWGGIEPVNDDAPKVEPTVSIDAEVERRLAEVEGPAIDAEPSAAAPATGKKRK